MASWQEIEKDAPSTFTSRVRAVFADGELPFGMMGGSMKLRDVRRDPRLAMHSPTLEPPAEAPETAPGDAKIAGVAVEMPAPPGTPHEGAGFFKLDIREVVLTYVGRPADHLVIETWHEGRGYRRRTRT